MAFDRDKMRLLIQGAVKDLWDKDQAGPALVEARLGPLVTALERTTISAVEVQRALDEYPVDKAKKFAAALKYAIDEVPGVCYTGVVFLDATIDQKTVNFNGWSEANKFAAERAFGFYNSPTFTCNATVFCVTPRKGGFRIGFVQDCTDKKSQSDFQDGSAFRYAYPVRFPMNDALGSPCTPFYGDPQISTQTVGKCLCTNPCWVEPIDEKGKEIKLEMEDDFQNNRFWGLAPSDNCGGLIDRFQPGKFVRQQEFTVWLARGDRSNTTVTPVPVVRLLRQIDYVNYTALTWDAQGAVRRDTSLCQVTKMNPNKVLNRPPVNADTMPGDIAENTEARVRGRTFVRLTRECGS